jgi:hypothetical protein
MTSPSQSAIARIVANSIDLQHPARVQPNLEQGIAWVWNLEVIQRRGVRRLWELMGDHAHAGRMPDCRNRG